MTEWVMICDPTAYDVVGAFEKLNVIDWKQSTNIEQDDVIYVYVGAPLSRIMYKCIATRVDLEETTIDDSEFVIDDSSYKNYGRYMELTFIENLTDKPLNLKALKDNGCKSVQGPFRVAQKLHDYIEESIKKHDSKVDNIYKKIHDFLPYIKKYEKLGLQQEKLRKQFVSDYNMLKIKNLTKEAYVVGINKDSFCNRLENELVESGNIHGATSMKFGLYYGKLGDDTNRQYRMVKSKFGEDSDKALEEIKKEIVFLFLDGEKQDIDAINKNKLAPIFKGKLLATYHPDKYISIFSNEHLDYFLKCLKIPFSYNASEVEKQVLLMNWYKNNKTVSKWDVYVYYRFLYHAFGNPSEMKKAAKDQSDDISLVEDLKDIVIDEALLGNYENKPKDKPKAKIDNEIKRYQRDRGVALNALFLAGYNCELGKDHPSFIRRRTGQNYTEPHHLIPMAYQDMFDYSLDTEANIISLCSNCHNQLHYGKGAEALLKILFLERRDALNEAGINITWEQLKELYTEIN